ncbi:unnamed protein product [Ceratitis capitata]|uniref:(Mediterranean fruit fly) hypothetical protein n=1 Tax=Ceratitis capitata TaxID=7213 RepID=A0A811UFH8_CERCA|nr:unnamed protein product [Ceratitis capitata]
MPNQFRSKRFNPTPKAAWKTIKKNIYMYMCLYERQHPNCLPLIHGLLFSRKLFALFPHKTFAKKAQRTLLVGRRMLDERKLGNTTQKKKNKQIGDEQDGSRKSITSSK